MENQPERQPPRLPVFPNLPPALGFGEEHALLRAEARRLFSARGSLAALRGHIGAPAPLDRDLWAAISRLGWLAAALPEELGGSGPGALSLALVAEEAGRTLLSAPFVATALALTLTARADDETTRRALSAELLGGATVATVALGEPEGRTSPLQAETRAVFAGARWQLTGTKTHVPFAEDAGLVLLSARKDTDGSLGVFLLRPGTSGLSITPDQQVDPSAPTGRLELCDAPAELLVGGSDGAEGALAALRALTAMERLGLVLVAAELTGAAETLLSMTTAYATMREQFGKPIGAFQAVKHPLVDLLAGVELSRSLTLAAAAALDADPAHAEAFCRMAKACASDVAASAAKKSVQLHGGFGFTWEADVHLYLRRMLAARGQLGDALEQRGRLGELLIAGSSPSPVVSGQ